MAQSYVTFTGNGSSTGPITLGFNYILKAHVKVYQTRDILANTGTLLSETTHYTFNTAGTQVSMVTAPANGVVITVERQTPNDDQIVPYADGSNLIADSLNNSDKQTLFCTQELEDRQELSAAKADTAKTTSETASNDVAVLTANYFKRDGTLPMTGNLQLGTNKITGVGDPTNAQDAVTKAYLERTGSIASAQIVDGTIVDGDVNASAAISGSKLQASSGSNAGSMSSAHYTKLEGIEASATADQTATEIKSSYESNSDTNAYTDAEKTKLASCESNAKDDLTASEIKSLYESNSNTNAITDTEKTNIGTITNKQPLDSELTTLAGMQAATASKLAGGTALTSDIADLNQIDGLTKQTTISDSDASFPTSGAVVDYVAAQIAPIGGLEVIADDQSFPNTQPASGVVISIADAGGLVVASGSSTTARTAGGTTVTINNIASNFNGTTVDAGVAMMVSSTGSGHIYNYHKATLKEADLLNLSNDINDFAARYRVGSSNPSSALDAGDLFFNTSTSKLLVYNATNTAWEEAQSIGNFYISTLSPAFNGSLQDFTITNAPTNAEQILLSINGVIQKPNAGTSTPSEGFALSGSTVKLGAAPASTDTYFAVVIGSTVNIGTPSNNTVSTAILQNGSVTNEKINASANIAGSKLADDSITEAKLDIHAAPSGTDKFLAYTSNGMEWAVPTDTNTQRAFANDANNRVVTGDGSGGLNGEANLTYDGNDITQTIDASGEGFNQTAAGNHFIDNVASSNRSSAEGVIWRQTADWNGKTVAQIKLTAGSDTTNKDDGYITFWTSAANDNDERVRITSAGNVGIGSTSPHDSSWGTEGNTKHLHIKGTTYGVLSLEGDNTANTKWSMGAGDGRFYMAYNENDQVHCLDAVRSTRDVEVLLGNLVMKAAGKGIDFAQGSSVGTAANILDEYEEGTFTPTWGHGGSALSGVTYSQQTGFYTKVGNMCHVAIWINTTGNTNTSTSDVLQLNLPFASKNSSGYRGGMTYTFNGMNAADAWDDSDDQVIRTHINYNVAWMEVGFGSNLNGGSWSTDGFTTGSIINGSAGIQLEGTYLVG